MQSHQASSRRRALQVTLPDRVARMYLEMDGEWGLQPLAGISTAPLLSSDGSVRAAEGYDHATSLWCANVPTLRIPDHSIRAEAEAALRLLRQAVRTFPFADAPRRKDAALGVEVVNLDRSPGMDESTFLVGLLTATKILLGGNRKRERIPVRNANCQCSPLWVAPV